MLDLRVEEMTGPTRKFALEKWMTTPTSDWLAAQGRFELRWEFRLPWGICDVVGVEFDTERVNERMDLRQTHSIGPADRIAVLLSIPDEMSGESIPPARLASAMSSTEQDIQKHVKELIKTRFVVCKTDGSLQRRTLWAPLHTRILAIELKLDRIEEVIAQASSHRAIASEALIGLPREKAERLMASSRLSSLEQAGVGLLAVDPLRAELLLRPPLHTSADPVLQMHCVERFWPKYPKGRPS